MMEVFEGRLGGGKSFSAVMRCLAHLGTGGTLVTNIALNWPKVEEFIEIRFGVHIPSEHYIYLKEEQIPEFFRHVPLGDGGSILAVIDEAHLFWNSRDWDKTSRDFLAWLTQSRKIGVDIIFISQSNLNMDKQFMRLIQYIWRFRDMSRFKVPGLGMHIPFVGNRILQTQFDYDGKTYLHRWFARKDQAIFACYESNALLKPIPGYETMMAGKKITKVQLQKKTTKRNMWKTYLSIFMAFVLMVGYFAYRQYQKFIHPEIAVAKITGSEPPKATPQRVQQAQRDSDSQPHADYDIVTESFRAQEDGRYVKTDVATYYIGRMSPHGMVMDMREGVVKCMEPNRRIMYVLCDPNGGGALVQAVNANVQLQRAISPPTPQPTATPAPTKAPEQEHLKEPAWMGHTLDNFQLKSNSKKGNNQQTQSQPNVM